MRPSLFQRLLQTSLVKFCIVGFSSTLIDKTVLFALLTLMPLCPWFVSQSIAFLFGVTNGFFWNRRWTFALNEPVAAKSQYPKFVATNAVGLVLNLLISKFFLVLFTGSMIVRPTTHKSTILIASLCAVPLVVIWNFTASRLWTFKAGAGLDVNSLPA